MDLEKIVVMKKIITFLLILSVGTNCALAQDQTKQRAKAKVLSNGQSVVIRNCEEAPLWLFKAGDKVVIQKVTVTLDGVENAIKPEWYISKDIIKKDSVYSKETVNVSTTDDKHLYKIVIEYRLVEIQIIDLEGKLN